MTVQAVEEQETRVIPFGRGELTRDELLIDELEEALVEAYPTYDLDDLTTHRFSNGVYAREMLIPAGTCITSMLHKVDCITTCSAGTIWVWTAGSNGGFKRISAPFTAETPAGTRRVGVTESDTVWTTYHATDSTDVDEIEREIYDERCLKRRKIMSNRSKELQAAKAKVVELVSLMASEEE